MLYNNFLILLTGDMGKSGEMNLVRSRYNIKCDILKLGHHGSNTSSHELFIKRVAPEAAVVSVGKNNVYGHPSPLVINRIKDNNIPLWRTDNMGAVIINTDGNNYDIKGYLKK